ncbi:MAG TPA: hypothetical protein VNA16_07470 [Abditibacteriaceae bacterium]|nr:hypothetical protein [Abditibacteriaceae bacterium]
MKPSKEEQIHALLTGKAYELAIKTLNVHDMSEHQYEEVFTVTREDIDDYVRLHGVPMDRVITEADGGEGIHFIRQNGMWLVYWWERGEKWAETKHRTEKGAIQGLVNFLLDRTATGINYTKRRFYRS